VNGQATDLGQFPRLLSLYRRHPWLLRTPLRQVQRLFFPRHTVLDPTSFYPRAMALVGLVPQQPLERYREEIQSDGPLCDRYCSAVESGRIARKYRCYADRLANTANLVVFYALVRETRPSVVVETGTATGSMTSWILAALRANGHGRLISIDLPPIEGRLQMGVTVAPDDVGFLIPPAYRDRWEYIQADAKVMLPRVLVDNPVDMFVHDSLHTRTHMLFEYNVARCLMRPHGVLVSDDILWNRAFFDFVVSHRLASLGCITNPNLGFTCNRFDDFELGVGTAVVQPPDARSVAAT